MGQTVQTCPEPRQKRRSRSSCHACGLWEDGCAESPRRRAASPVAGGRRAGGAGESSVLLPKPAIPSISKGSLRDQLKNRPSADERWKEAKEEWERQVARQIEEAELKRSAAALAEATASAQEGGGGELDERLSAMAMIKAEDEDRAKAAEARAKAEDERRRSDAEAAERSAQGGGKEEARQPLDAIEEEASLAPTPRQTSPRSTQAPEGPVVPGGAAPPGSGNPEQPPLPAGDAGLAGDFQAVLSTRSRSALPPELAERQQAEVAEAPQEQEPAQL